MMPTPMIDQSKLPTSEAGAAWSVTSNLCQLAMLATEFRYAADLYLEAHAAKLAERDDSRRMVAWMGMAGRSGALVAYGVYQVMQQTNSTKAPELWKMVDVESRRRAIKRFQAEFPQIAAIRVSAAHPGELTASDKERKRHGLKITSASSSGVFSQGSLVSAMAAHPDYLQFSATVEGELVSYELSLDKAERLEEIVKVYASAFKLLDRWAISNIIP